ncbi:MAG TPA: glycosyltransferase family 87 protein [Patescibacteria group bacterium]|nr:glycosyltransferase family 87 protein [Patescibacteria group bacterium]
MRSRLLRDGFVILALAFVALRLLEIKPWADSVDAYAYWTTRDGVFYDGAATGRIGAYLYSPAFAQMLAPLVWLPLAVFTAVWTALNIATLWFLLRRWALPSLLFVPIAFEVVSGNVHLMYAAAIVIGFRWPAAWALMILTKVTPGIGVVWFLVRHEWRSFGIALGATAAITAGSLVLDPGHWVRWVEVLRAEATATASGDVSTTGWYLPVALAPRLLIAVIVTAAGALTNRRWLVPVAVVLAMPVVWLNSLAVLAACVPLRSGVGDSPGAPRAV